MIQYIIRIIYSGISRVYLSIYIFINDVFVCTNVCVCMTIVSRQSFCGFEKTTHLITLSAVNFLFFSFLKKKSISIYDYGVAIESHFEVLAHMSICVFSPLTSPIQKFRMTNVSVSRHDIKKLQTFCCCCPACVLQNYFEWAWTD